MTALGGIRQEEELQKYRGRGVDGRQREWVCMCARKRVVKEQEEGDDVSKEPEKEREREKGCEVEEGYVG